MADFPIYESLLCELVGLAGGLSLGLGIGREFGWAGGIIGMLLGATVGSVCARLARLRHNFVTVFDVFEAIGLMCGLSYAVTFRLELKLGGSRVWV